MLASRGRATTPSTVILERHPEQLSEPDFVAESPPERFAAFAGLVRAHGWLRLDVARLTDLLNAHAAITLRHAEVEHLADGRTQVVDELELVRDQIVVVQATGRLGDPALRRRTRLLPIAGQSGCFLFAGFLHAAPGLGPTEELATRPPMVPLTDAWLEYWAGGHARRQWVGTMIFNRQLAEWIEPLAERDGELDRPTWRGVNEDEPGL